MFSIKRFLASQELMYIMQKDKSELGFSDGITFIYCMKQLREESESILSNMTRNGREVDHYSLTSPFDFQAQLIAIAGNAGSGKTSVGVNSLAHIPADHRGVFICIDDQNNKQTNRIRSYVKSNVTVIGDVEFDAVWESLNKEKRYTNRSSSLSEAFFEESAPPIIKTANRKNQKKNKEQGLTKVDKLTPFKVLMEILKDFVGVDYVLIDNLSQLYPTGRPVQDEIMALAKFATANNIQLILLAHRTSDSGVKGGYDLVNIFEQVLIFEEVRQKANQSKKLPVVKVTQKKKVRHLNPEKALPEQFFLRRLLNDDNGPKFKYLEKYKEPNRYKSSIPDDIRSFIKNKSGQTVDRDTLEAYLKEKGHNPCRTTLSTTLNTLRKEGLISKVDGKSTWNQFIVN